MDSTIRIKDIADIIERFCPIRMYVNGKCIFDDDKVTQPIAIDKEYAKVCCAQLKQERDNQYKELYQMILTGKDSNGDVIPKHILNKLEKKYEKYEKTKELFDYET